MSDADVNVSGRIRAGVTVSLVEQVRGGGPFVFWDDLEGAIRRAGELGFDGIEIFAPGPEAIDIRGLRGWLERDGVALAAVGTGAGWVVHRLSLTSADAGVREKARAFVRQIIDVGAPFGAPAIIGSMQGRLGDGVSREQAFKWLGEALEELGEHAATQGVPLVFEPLNRYETNLVNTVEAGVGMLEGLKTRNVKLLCDLFHMNIEEADIAAALRVGGGHIGHVHFVDSNRRPAGFGHIDYTPIATALRDIDYRGYASAEALAWPDPDAAAVQTMKMFKGVFGGPEVV